MALVSLNASEAVLCESSLKHLGLIRLQRKEACTTSQRGGNRVGKRIPLMENTNKPQTGRKIL